MTPSPSYGYNGATLLSRLFKRKQSPDFLQEMKLKEEGWKIPLEGTPPHQLFPALVGIFPSGAVLFLEVSGIDRQIYQFCEENEIASVRAVKQKSSWPLPSRFYLPLRADVLAGLAELAAGKPAHKICDHLYVVCDHEMLMEAQEFGIREGKLPLVLSHRIRETRVGALAKKLGKPYEKGGRFHAGNLL